MSKSNVFEQALLELIFNATPIAGLASDAAVGAIDNLYLALHTSDPGEAGNQGTNEVAYAGYARVAVARTAAGWVVTGSSVSPAAPIEFGEMTAGDPTNATFATLGTDATGAGRVLYRGALTPPVPIQVGTVPILRQTSAITED